MNNVNIWDIKDKELSETGNKVKRGFENYGMYLGRLICGSKGFYSNKYPDHETYYNANVFTENSEKVWYGDLDLTIDLPKLQSIANDQNLILYVLREMDGRFENEILPSEIIMKKAVATIKPK